MSKTHFCAQRGCSFDVPDNDKPAVMAADGVTVVEPASSTPGNTPELCPVCGNPFLEHPAPETL